MENYEELKKDITVQMAALRARCNRTTRVWTNEDGSICTEEQAAANQRLYRTLRARYFFLTQEELVFSPQSEEAEVLKFMPLVSRRKHTEIWKRLGDFGKSLQDFDLFTFDETPHQHSVGNWNCQGCLNLGQEIVTAEDASNAMAAPKALDWCPRFLGLLRHLPIIEYAALIKTETGNKMCYAGLMHSEMRFVDKYFDKVKQELLSEDEMGLFDLEHDPDRYELKKFVQIVRKCDTCGNQVEEEKEYQEPEPVKAGDVLIEEDNDKDNN